MLAAVNHLFARGVRRRVPAARRVGRVPRPGLRPPGRAARHRQGVVRGQRDALAPRRGAARRAARARARRRGRTRAPGEIVLLFAAGTDAEWYEEELRALGPADLPRDRARLLRPAAGRRPARLPAAAAQPLRRRGARHRARLAVRRRLERRARAAPAGAPDAGRSSPASSASLPPALDERRRAAARARSSSATSGSSRPRPRALARAALRAGRLPSTTTTSPCSRAGTAGAATRTCASWCGSRARTRSCAAATSRASSASSASRRRSARRELEAVAEEEGADAVRLLTIHAAKGLEFKVVVVADAGRDTGGARRRTRSSRSPTAASASRSCDPATGERRGAFGYEEVRERGARPSSGGAAAPLLRRDDARDRPADRLGSVDSSERRRPTPIGWVLARLDASEELAGGGGAGRARARRRDACSCASTASRRGRRGRGGARGARTGSSRSSPSSRRAPVAARLPAARARAGAARRRSTRRAGSRTRRSRSSSAARTATTPSASPACAERRARRRAGRRRARGDRDRRRRAPAARGGRPGRARARRTTRGRCAAGIPASTDEELERIGALVAPYCDSRARRAARRARRRAARAAVRVRARRRAAPRPPRRRSTATARGRSSSTTRRTCSASGRRRRSSRRTTACSGSSTRSRASAPGAEEVEVVYRSSSGRTRSSRRRSRAPTCRRSRPSCRRRSRGSTRASSGRRRASSRAPAARRSTSSAPGRGCARQRRRRRRRRAGYASPRAGRGALRHPRQPAGARGRARRARARARSTRRHRRRPRRRAASASSRSSACRARRPRPLRPRQRATGSSPRAAAEADGALLGSEQLDVRARALAARRVTLDVDGLGPTLFCHATPRSDEEIFTERDADEVVARRCSTATAEATVVCGHTHLQVDRRVAGWRIVNAGSVGLPERRRRGAYWAILGPDVELRQTDYDRERGVRAVPATRWYATDRGSFLVENLLTPPTRAEALDFFESTPRASVARSYVREARRPRRAPSATGSARSSSGWRPSTRTRRSRCASGRRSSCSSR